MAGTIIKARRRRERGIGTIGEQGEVETEASLWLNHREFTDIKPPLPCLSPGPLPMQPIPYGRALRSLKSRLDYRVIHRLRIRRSLPPTLGTSSTNERVSIANSLSFSFSALSLFPSLPSFLLSSPFARLFSILDFYSLEIILSIHRICYLSEISIFFLMNVIYKMKFSVRLWIRSGDFNFSKSFLLFFFFFFFLLLPLLVSILTFALESLVWLYTDMRSWCLLFKQDSN